MAIDVESITNVFVVWDIDGPSVLPHLVQRRQLNMNLSSLLHGRKKGVVSTRHKRMYRQSKQLKQDQHPNNIKLFRKKAKKQLKLKKS